MPFKTPSKAASIIVHAASIILNGEARSSSPRPKIPPGGTSAGGLGRGTGSRKTCTCRNSRADSGR